MSDVMEIQLARLGELIEALIGRAEADGCLGCAFESCEEWEMPCKKCKRNCKDYWRAKGDER